MLFGTTADVRSWLEADGRKVLTSVEGNSGDIAAPGGRLARGLAFPSVASSKSRLAP